MAATTCRTPSTPTATATESRLHKTSQTLRRWAGAVVWNVKTPISLIPFPIKLLVILMWIIALTSYLFGCQDSLQLTPGTASATRTVTQTPESVTTTTVIDVWGDDNPPTPVALPPTSKEPKNDKPPTKKSR